jgi:hypothetical protein
MSPRSHARRCADECRTHLASRWICARLAQVLDLIFEDNRLNVYAGKLEVRPPGAPTIAVVSALLQLRDPAPAAGAAP